MLNLAGLAEAVIGEGKDYRHVQFLTISTGLGSGLVIDHGDLSGSPWICQRSGQLHHGAGRTISWLHYSRRNRGDQQRKQPLPPVQRMQVLEVAHAGKSMILPSRK